MISVTFIIFFIGVFVTVILLALYFSFKLEQRERMTLAGRNGAGMSPPTKPMMPAVSRM